MGHNDVKYEARGGASIENWLLGRGRRVAIGGVSRRLARRISRPLPVLAAGSVALVVPLLLHGASIRSPTLRAALETAVTLFALGAARLLYAQFATSRRRRDLLLVCASLAAGVLTLGLGALPAALDVRTGGFLAAAALCGHLLVAGIFLAAAVTGPGSVVARPIRPAATTLLIGLVACLTAGLGGLTLTALGLAPAAHAGTLTETVRFALVLIAAGLLVSAATTFVRRHVREPDRIPALLALATFLLAGTAVSHLTTHPLPRDQIGAGQALRTIAWGLIFAMAVALERRARGRLTRAAALAERRRVARDLHDGLAQDLALIAAHGPQMSRELGEEHPVVVAARRALAISRSTISDLADPAGASMAEALDAVAQELRERFDVAIAVNAQVDDPIAAGTREHLSRIAREAIANAARHGQARNVLVSLRRAEFGVALRVVDDGCGIPTGDDGVAPEGFGLRSMRERAGSLGGSLSVRRVPEGGTELEVVLP
jgi:signal transduction histidine kinase